MTKVISRIVGGIGNQLFCYAVARRMALVNSAELVIDNVSGFLYDRDYKRTYQLDHFNIPCRIASASELLQPIHRVRRYIKRRWNQRLQYSQRSYLMQEGIDFDPRVLIFQPRGTVYLEGCWQSEDYFKDVADTLRQDLRIRPPNDAGNLAMAAKMRGCNAVAVHMRFFDEPAGPTANNITSSYYQSAFESMKRIAPGAHYFIFSDRPDSAGAWTQLPDAQVTIVNLNRGDERAYADLWLMTQCQHFITANSTFSWWGAWLAESELTKVITPRQLTGTVTGWGFKGQLPDRWIKL